ncbi:hypothetical protein ZWY2020_058312 [Hordeum vulgare]|nr:hypothetical protein ZWY2020_058312 [Hordeum vulgare]
MLHGSTSRSSSPPSPFCHSHDVAYRDLKPENLLLDEEDRLKVTNFGLPALLEQLRHDDMLHTQCGTPGYIAPEVLQKRGYDGARGDMRSRGVMLYVLEFLLFREPCSPLTPPSASPSRRSCSRRGSRGAVMAVMNIDMGGLAGRPTTSQVDPFQSALYGAGPGLIQSGLGAYSEKFLGSSSDFMQSNITQYLSNPQYYFQVNNQYVWNKLKVVLFPFLHRGHWTRTTELVGGRLSYKPPVQDISAPDMYIPLMAFTTYIVVAGYALGVLGRKLHSQNNF